MEQNPKQPDPNDDGKDLYGDEPPILPPNKINTRTLPFGVASGDVKSGVISAIVCIVILALMVMAGGVGLVTKNDFTANLASFGAASEQAQADLATISEQVQADVAKAKTDVALAIQDVSGTITSAVNTAVSQATGLWGSQLSDLGDKDNVLASNFQANTDSIVALDTKQANDVIALNDDIDALDEDFTDLNADVLALETKVADLEVKIAALETVEQISTSSAVSATLKMQNYVLYPTAPTATTPSTLTSSFRIVLNNTTNVVQNDIILHITVGTSLPNSGDVEFFTLSGGGTIWQGYGLFAGEREFINNQWGLNLAGNTSKTLYMTMTITAKDLVVDFRVGIYEGGIGYNVDVEVD